jgi:hypothetical protein
MFRIKASPRLLLISSREVILKLLVPLIQRGHFICTFIGDIICTERPLTWVHGHHPFNDEQIAEIDQNVAALNEEERVALLSMANVWPEISSPGAGIFMTNSFDMTDSPNGDSCGMYCAIARLNHSCNPNAQQTHIPETGEEVLVASRDIEVGDEINDCYIDLRQTKSERRRILSELYRFECCCVVCSMESSEADDKARSRAMQLDGSVLDAAEADADTALLVAEQYLSLLKSHCSLSTNTATASCSRGWSDRYMAGAHLYMYQIASVLGKAKLAHQHITEAHSWNTVLQGPNTPDSQNTLALTKKLRR